MQIGKGSLRNAKRVAIGSYKISMVAKIKTCVVSKPVKAIGVG